MKRKAAYISPLTEIIGMETRENIAQFVISSQNLDENAGEAKQGFYDEEEEEEANWGTVWAD